ncbi:MAG: tyrosine-type recombinase/integrase [Aetokthonos hydrillicola CCALA 1050]|nr:tyrosine-type recombinase/integrase [Aetokthonos hydrillicola CCALA 1050]MBW4586383.1 tyrosine-type recombinase/integrase [Aetokthonos hydrillicola CCALA 1050]
MLLYTAGLRVNELCSLRWKDLSPKKPGGQLAIFGKGEKTRIILLPEPVWQKLCKLRNNALSSDPVFTSREKDSLGTSLDQSQVNRIVAKAAKAAGINKKVSPHWLRHAHAIHSLSRGAPLHLVQNTLGHSSISTTSRYLHAHHDDSSALYLNVLPDPTKQNTQQSTDGNQHKPQKQKQNRTKVEKNTSFLKCPNCKSKELQQYGFQILADGLNHKRFRCVTCDYVFTPLLSIPT